MNFKKKVALNNKQQSLFNWSNYYDPAYGKKKNILNSVTKEEMKSLRKKHSVAIFIQIY